MVRESKYYVVPDRYLPFNVYHQFGVLAGRGGERVLLLGRASTPPYSKKNSRFCHTGHFPLYHW